MPQIIIEHTIDFHDLRFVEELRDKMARLCATLFRGENSIGRDSFSFKFDRILPPSTSTHDIVVRIHLHHYESRVRTADVDAQSIRDLMIHLLSHHGFYMRQVDSPTVGVSLTYGEVSWQSGTLRDTAPDSLERVFDLIDPKRPIRRRVLTDATSTSSYDLGTGIED